MVSTIMFTLHHWALLCRQNLLAQGSKSMTSFKFTRKSTTTDNNQKHVPWFRDPAKNPEYHDEIQRRVPYHRYPSGWRKRIHHRSWSNMDTEAKLEDARLQFIFAEGWICHYSQGACVYMELRSLTKMLHSPIKFSGEFTEGKLAYFFARISNWTNKLPRTRDEAIESLERLIKTCENLLAELHDQQRNEFYYTMGIKRIDLDPSGEDIYEKLFAPELKELRRAEA